MRAPGGGGRGGEGGREREGGGEGREREGGGEGGGREGGRGEREEGGGREGGRGGREGRGRKGVGRSKSILQNRVPRGNSPNRCWPWLAAPSSSGSRRR